MANPSRDTIEDLALATQPMESPVVLFVDCTDTDLTRAAIEAGIWAYMLAGLQPTARRRCLMPPSPGSSCSVGCGWNSRSPAALEERMVIDRAKGIVMKTRGVFEDEAYALMGKTAMDRDTTTTLRVLVRKSALDTLFCHTDETFH